ncbi:hypothetical protein BZM27_06175 [Paraburkholderia steynii]|uniref:Uncharacterized protein n=1 Tax=Paraburkholderia steynii TaxID=1245441 RepID=A0A4R0XGF0_9BURK|nr:hypothetical protein BZM27_06175 [Paraburkholderia steynii]
MGAPDLSNWIWPDADLQRQPQGVVTVNPQVFPSAVRCFVGGRDVLTNINLALPLIQTPAGTGYTNTSNSAAAKQLSSTLATSSGAGAGDFTIICVHNLAASGSQNSVAWAIDANKAAPGFYVQMNADTSGALASGDMTFGDFNNAGIALTGAVDGKSHAVIFTRRGTTLYAFMDGALKSTLASYTYALPASGNAEWVGGSGWANTGVVGGGVPLIAVSNRGLTIAEGVALSANPWQIFKPATMALYMPAAAGGVTVGLSQVAGAGSVGAVGIATGLSATGVSATGATGSAGYGEGYAITGAAATGSTGIATPASSPVLAGASATGSMGTAAPSITAALTGVSGASSVGSVTPGTSAALTQVAATGSTGSVSEGISLALSGVAGTGYVGTVSSGGNITQALSGAPATGAVGSVSPSLSLVSSGVSATGSTGSLAPTRALSGVSGASTTGAVTQSISPTLVGSSAAGSTGAISAGADKNAALTGAAATSSVGSVGTNVSIGLAGISATASTGVLASSLTYGLVGNASATSVGSILAVTPKSIAAPPVTFPIYRERRVFSIPSESRISPVPAERRIIKVAA